MKKLVFIVCFMLCSAAPAQECEYALTVQNEDGTSLKLTQEKVMYYKITPLSTEVVYFSLYTEEENKFVLFKYVRDAKGFVPSICINDKSRLSFQLANGAVVSLRQAGEASCGYIDRKEDSDYNNNTLESLFYLHKDALDKLKDGKITLMGLRTPSDQKDFVIASQLSLPQSAEEFEPGRYFEENIHCIE